MMTNAFRKSRCGSLSRATRRIGSAAFLLLAVLAAMVALAVLEIAPGTASRSERPNIILVLLDDARADALQYMPHLARLMRRRGSVQFERAYVAAPLCCPARASILRGEYAYRHGIYQNNASVPDGGAVNFTNRGLDRNALPTWLQDQGGYATAYLGKYMNGYHLLDTYIPPGWNYWSAFSIVSGRHNVGYFNYTLSQNGQIISFGSAPADYSTDVFTRKALRVVGHALSEDRHFFVVLAPFAPHDPATPAPRHTNELPGLAAPRQDVDPSYNEADVSDKPSFFRNLTWTAELEVLSDRLYADGARSVLAVDETIAAVVAELEGDHALENTVIIVTSDHGFSNGSHRWLGKECAYEPAARIPLVIIDPRLGSSSRVVSQLVSQVDIPATIADLAGVTPAIPPQGQSLVPLMQNPDASWTRQEILLEGRSGGLSFATIVTSDTPDLWKYTEHDVTRERELYRLADDPFELTNRADEPALAPVVQDLSARLRALRGR